MADQGNFRALYAEGPPPAGGKEITVPVTAKSPPSCLVQALGIRTFSKEIKTGTCVKAIFIFISTAL